MVVVVDSGVGGGGVAAVAAVVVVFTVVNAAFAAVGVAVLGFYCCCNVWPFSCGVGPYAHHPIID